MARVNPNDPANKILTEEMEKRELTLEDLGRLMCCGRSTAHNRKCAPFNMRTDELAMLAKAWEWSDTQIADFVRACAYETAVSKR